MNFENRTVLFAEIPGRKSIGAAPALLAATQGRRYAMVTDIHQATTQLTSDPSIEVFVTNEPSVELFEAARNSAAKITTVLVTDLPMAQYCESLKHREHELIDHIIANTNTDWAILDLSVSLQKIIRQDIFGIEKYLSPNSRIESKVIRGSSDREPTNRIIHEWAEKCGFGKNLGRLAFGISEELLMNAIYDAPIAGGRSHYEDLDRQSARNLAEDEWAHLRWGADDRLLAISIQDPFGAFQRDKWFAYLAKALKRNDANALIDTKKSGAGLGLFKMLYSSHGVVCNVRPGKLTEVIILISTQIPVRDFVHMPRSIHYFGASE